MTNWLYDIPMFVACAILACSCSSELENPRVSSVAEGSSELVYDGASQKVFRVGEAVPFTGTARWYYPNRSVKQETQYRNGLENGVEEWWHQSGNRAGRCSYSNGEMDGVFIQWFDDVESRVELQVNYKNGRRNGIETIWYPNGQERSLVNFHDGLRNGEAKGWYENGKLEWRAVWRNDSMHGEHKEWYQSGGVKFHVNYRDDQKTGMETVWFESGVKSRETSWDKGLETGLRTEWYPSGDKLLQYNFKGGVRVGVSVEWYENQIKALESQYDHNGGLVKFARWNPDGVVIPDEQPPSGRVRTWRKAEFEPVFVGKSEDRVYTVFGEPDRVVNGDWIIEGISSQEGKVTVAFSFKSGKVLSLKFIER